MLLEDTLAVLTRKTLRRSRVSLPLDQWSETTTHKRWQTNKVQHGDLRADRCPWSIDRLFKLSYTYISDIVSKKAVTLTQHTASTGRVSSKEYRETRRVDQQKPKTQIKMTSKEYGETRCGICQNGQKCSRRILWMTVSQTTETHPQVLLVSYLQSREEKWYRASTVFTLISQRTEIATSA